MFAHTLLMVQAAEALGAIGLESNVPILEHSLAHDPAQEVRETCELALSRIKQLKAAYDSSSMTERSPFMSVDPAPPASSCSSIGHLRFIQLLSSRWASFHFYSFVCWLTMLLFFFYREVLLDEERGMYDRYAALFALRNHGGDEAIKAIIDSLGANSALLRHEVSKWSDCVTCHDNLLRRFNYLTWLSLVLFFGY